MTKRLALIANFVAIGCAHKPKFSESRWPNSVPMHELYKVNGRNYIAYLDEKGMPRCIADADNHRSGFAIQWNDSNNYKRKVKVANVSRLQNSETIAHCSAWSQYQ